MKKKKPNIFVIIPAFNEESQIASVVKSVAKHCDTVIVVDDGSSDKTSEAARGSNAIVLKHCINLGQGAALQTGLDYCIPLRPDVVLTFDADGQFVSSEIPKLVELLISKNYDIVLGSRFLGNTENMPRFRKILLKIAIFITKVFSNIKLTDTHNGFRAMNYKTAKLIKIKHNRMTHASEIIDTISKNNLSFAECPVTVKYSQYSLGKGQSNAQAVALFFEILLRKFL